MKKRSLWLTGLVLMLMLAICGCNSTKKVAKELEGHSLMIYCGAGMTEPFQKIADAF